MDSAKRRDLLQKMNSLCGRRIWRVPGAVQQAMWEGCLLHPLVFLAFGDGRSVQIRIHLESLVQEMAHGLFHLHEGLLVQS